MKRMMSDTNMELVLPLQKIEEGIDRNLRGIPEDTRKIIKKVEEFEKKNRMNII
jgi:hypothetical protein